MFKTDTASLTLIDLKGLQQACLGHLMAVILKPQLTLTLEVRLLLRCLVLRLANLR